MDKLAKLGTRKIEKELNKIEKNVNNQQNAESEMRESLELARGEQRKLSKKTSKVLNKIETAEKDKIAKFEAEQRNRIGKWAESKYLR